MLNRNVPYHGYLEDLHGKEEHLILHNLHQQHALGNTALHHESDISIEVGRNSSYDANVSGHSTLNNSYFKVNNTTNPLSCEKPSTTIDVSQTHPLGNHQLDLDLDFHSDIELDDNIIPETPTKSQSWPSINNCNNNNSSSNNSSNNNNQ